jgi:hypothetical protein
MPRNERPDDGNAFLPDPGDGPAHVDDDLAQELAEEFITAATSGEEVAPDEFDAEVPEDRGGPFQTTREREEFAYDTDASNPEDATRESTPSPMRGS